MNVSLSAASEPFVVEGMALPRPFKVRRLGHFGLNVQDPARSLDFYQKLLGFRVSDELDFTGRLPEAEMAPLGPRIGYFIRHGTEHHSMVLFPRRVLTAAYGYPKDFPEVTSNQITWQVGSLREVVDGHRWLAARGHRIHRVGRDTPGSNWNVYPFDPEGHVNELFFGIEQIGWSGLSKPAAMHSVRYREPPKLPHVSEFAEVNQAISAGVDAASGWRQTEPNDEKYDVGGVLLGRPFKIVKIGPVRIFVSDMDKCLAFYRDELGLEVTESITWHGHRCVFLRANTEHHSLALYPLALRGELGLSPHTTVFSFGLQLGSYQQLRDAVDFLKASGVTVRCLPPELFPGIDYCAFAIDPDGHAMQLHHAMEQVGWDGRPRPAAQRAGIDNENWPRTLAPRSDSYAGEVYLGPWN